MIEPKIQEYNRIIFVGINPVKGSFNKTGYHYFKNNNMFYKLLFHAGYTKQIETDDKLKIYNFGIMNYCNYVCSYPANIPKIILKEARENFKKIIYIHEPLSIVFLGKFVPKHFFKIKKVEYGKLNYKQDGCVFYCVPFPTARITTKEKVDIYKFVLNDFYKTVIK